MNVTRAQQIDPAVYTAGVERSRREYQWHPFIRSCHSFCKCPMRAAGWRALAVKR